MFCTDVITTSAIFLRLTLVPFISRTDCSNLSKVQTLFGRWTLHSISRAKVAMAWTLIGLVIALIVIPRLFGLIVKDPKPVKGVYRLKGKWSFIKYWAFYVLFKLREYQNKRKTTVSGENAGYGIRSRSNIEEMEKPQVLPKDHPQVENKFYDFVFMNYFRLHYFIFSL